MARLDLAHISERRRLLRSRFVRTAAPARSENHGDAPVFVERPGEIRRYRGFVVGMRHHHENVRFVALIWLGERSEEHTSELQSLTNLVCRLLLEKKKKTQDN